MQNTIEEIVLMVDKMGDSFFAMRFDLNGYFNQSSKKLNLHLYCEG